MNIQKLLEDIAVRSPKAAARLKWEFDMWTKPIMFLRTEVMKAMRKGEKKKVTFLNRVITYKTQNRKAA